MKVQGWVVPKPHVTKDETDEPHEPASQFGQVYGLGFRIRLIYGLEWFKGMQRRTYHIFLY